MNVRSKVTFESSLWRTIGNSFFDLRMESGNRMQVVKMIRLLVFQSSVNPLSENTFV
jgi:hypothetical protein